MSEHMPDAKRLAETLSTVNATNMVMSEDLASQIREAARLLGDYDRILHPERYGRNQGEKT